MRQMQRRLQALETKAARATDDDIPIWVDTGAGLRLAPKLPPASPGPTDYRYGIDILSPDYDQWVRQ